MQGFASILAVDDEPQVREVLRTMLVSPDRDCVFAESAEQACELLAQTDFDLVISDLNMRGMGGMGLLEKIREMRVRPAVIVLTGRTDIPSAIEATRHGAFDYLTKPVQKDQLALSVARALEFGRISRAKDSLSRRVDRSPTYAGLIGQSAVMREVFRLIARCATGTANVLITGESGTGKEKVARAIHASSPRRGEKFNVVDCAAIPEGLIESILFGHKAGAFTGASTDSPGILGYASGGTVFFDEIGELPLPMQPRLLRVLQERTFTPVGASRPVSVDLRVLAATNRDLEEEVRKGRFRKDLFYRLNVVRIAVPPLRDRDDDSVGLARYFFAELSPDYPDIREISPESLDCIRAYSWPGNVRELRNAIERAMSMTEGDSITVEDLPAQVRKAGSSSHLGGAPPHAPDSWAELVASGDLSSFEREMRRFYLTELLGHCKGNVSKAAQHAGVSRNTLYRIAEELGISTRKFR